MKVLCKPIAILFLVGSFSFGDVITTSGYIEVKPGIKAAVELSFQSTSSKYYQVQISSDLIKWDNEGYTIKGTGGTVSTYVSTRNLASAFYRLSDNGDPNNTAPTGTRIYDQIVYSGPHLLGWNEMNLSAYIGTGEKMCLFEITKTSGSIYFDIDFVPKGKEFATPDWEYGKGFYAFGSNSGTFTNAGKENAPLRLYLICLTSSEGKIMWQTDNSGAQIEIRLKAIF